MEHRIKSASIILGTGEEVYGEFSDINIFIGKNSTAAIQALAEASCAIPFEVNNKMRMVNFTYCKKGKEYEISSVSTTCGTKALAKYVGEKTVFNKDAFSEHQCSLEESVLMGDVNVFDNRKKTAMDENLTQSTITHLNWNEFLNLISNPHFKRDSRPLFIWNLLDTIADDLKSKVLENLLRIERQIFIAILEDCMVDSFKCEKIFVNKVWDVVDT